MAVKTGFVSIIAAPRSCHHESLDMRSGSRVFAESRGNLRITIAQMVLPAVF